MENITTEQQYGRFFKDNEELTSVLEIGSNGLKELTSQEVEKVQRIEQNVFLLEIVRENTTLQVN